MNHLSNISEATNLSKPHSLRFWITYSRVAFGAGIDVLRTPYRAPKANAICERFLGSLQRECLDHFIRLSERHLHRIVKEYSRYFNHPRPHQGIDKQIPCQPMYPAMPATDGQVVSFPVLGGLHRDYQRRAA
jgi:transposase InsO family protein